MRQSTDGGGNYGKVHIQRKERIALRIDRRLLLSLLDSPGAALYRYLGNATITISKETQKDTVSDIALHREIERSFGGS